MFSKDGKRNSLEDRQRLIYENGSAIGIQGVARDVTERNRLKENWIPRTKWRRSDVSPAASRA
jgi:PAS domain S-box-containing protein